MESIKKATSNLLNDLNDESHPITNSSGCPIFSNSYSMTAGPTGPTLVQDTDLFDKLQHFDREQIPQRNVHALGTGAYGTFTCTNDMSRHTCARIFCEKGQKIDLFARFSGIFTEKGEAETVRDPRGFALKFYTKEGNWDLLAINTPVFNVRDAKLGPDAIHAFKRDPRTHEWNSDALWDFVVNHPESLHQTLMIFTDRDGTPASYRNMNAYGCNTFSLFNDKGERFWVKFHVISQLRSLGLDGQQARLIAGEDPDFLSRDLRKAIENRNFPKWTLSVQIMPEEEGYKNPWTFDCTKIWCHDDYPLQELGIIELNRNPTDFHAEVEQVAFSPSNTVRGIGFSPDRLLQGRIFLYPDTQFHRLGSNFKQIPINIPHTDLVTPYVGGMHQMEYGKTKFPHYHPSCFLGGSQRQTSDTSARTEQRKMGAKDQEPAIKCEKGAYYRIPEEGSDEDYFKQPKAFLEALSSKDCDHLAINIALSLSKCERKICEMSVDMLKKVCENLAKKVQEQCYKLKDGTSESVTQGQKLMKDLACSMEQNRFEQLVE